MMVPVRLKSRKSNIIDKRDHLKCEVVFFCLIFVNICHFKKITELFAGECVLTLNKLQRIEKFHKILLTIFKKAQYIY